MNSGSKFSALVSGHGRASPGHPRLAGGTTVVDARHKAGHDGGVA